MMKFVSMIVALALVCVTSVHAQVEVDPIILETFMNVL